MWCGRLAGGVRSCLLQKLPEDPGFTGGSISGVVLVMDKSEAFQIIEAFRTTYPRLSDIFDRLASCTEVIDNASSQPDSPDRAGKE